MKKVGFVGSGQVAETLADGFLKHGDAAHYGRNTFACIQSFFRKPEMHHRMRSCSIARLGGSNRLVGADQPS